MSTFRAVARSCSVTTASSHSIAISSAVASSLPRRPRPAVPRYAPHRALHSSRRDRLQSGPPPPYEQPTSSKNIPPPATTLLVEDHDAPGSGWIRVVSLNRPQARNAISRQLLADLSAQVEAIHSEPARGVGTRVLVLASEVDECFCAGADLKERKGMSQEETNDFLANLRHTFKRIAALPIPTIASVSGAALGGGLELALCTHLRVFSSTTSVGLPETRLAIIPGAGGTYRLPALVGLPRATDAVLTGRRIAPAEALDWGLCNYLASPESGDKGVNRLAALEKSLEVAREISQGGPIGIRAAVLAMQGGGMEDQENAAYESVLGTKDRVEALKAFGEKRKPVFVGE